MSYIRGGDRNQTYLLPPSLEDYVSEENPVRFLDAFVEQLDLKELGFHRAKPKGTGRPGYDPADLLNLYLYGYLNRIRSSRRLEAEAGRNLELMWLIRNLTPDFKTIADFRKDNTKAIKQVCREFTLLCKKMDLFGGEQVVIDGSKFQGVNGKSRQFSRQKLEKRLEEIDAKIEAYFQLLDTQDQEEDRIAPPKAEQMRTQIEQWQERKQRYQGYLKEMIDRGETQIALTDPDCRKMSTEHSSTIGYNVQTVVDSKHHLIVVHEVTNAINDQGQLAKMAIQAKEELGVEQLEALADAGYPDVEEVKRCEEQGITIYAPTQKTSANTKLGLFDKEQFCYESERDVYVCPANQELTYRFSTDEKGRPIRYYVGMKCAQCGIKAQCTRNKRCRRITRHEHEAVLERMRLRVQQEPEKMRLRKQIVEHPYGTIKHWMGMKCFLLRGKEKVGTEMSLAVLAYNVRRVINMLGVSQMITALG